MADYEIGPQTRKGIPTEIRPGHFNVPTAIVGLYTVSTQKILLTPDVIAADAERSQRTFGNLKLSSGRTFSAEIIFAYFKILKHTREVTLLRRIFG